MAVGYSPTSSLHCMLRPSYHILALLTNLPTPAQHPTWVGRQEQPTHDSHPSYPESHPMLAKGSRSKTYTVTHSFFA